MLIGLALFDASGLAGMFVYLIAHGSVLASLFVVVGLLLHRYSEVHEHRLHGRARSLVPAGLLFTAGGLAVTGFPLFGTFVGKGLIEEAAAAAGFGHHDLDGSRPPGRLADARPRSLSHAGHSRSAEAFQSAAYYRDAIFEDGGAAAPQVEPVALAMRPALIKSSLAVILAAAIAAANLFSALLPASLRRAGTAAGAPLRTLRSSHSGHVGDYVMWMTIGIGLFGAASLWMLVLQ